ncbi:hypothetical protein GPECTOR_1g397 [Gonium pectorale]|uniref:Uncharacterized protein n=1 Tax=Gonium pectorale TaxID=33097 RepID=A0A150H357_GONPE|nr:hypothetical protein GPECTOR_1g397 [Gonium pectorale]|eukprot:KXZ56443.1 hypothetical protein GPECTOR_1g397 [Gonium pectorale]
MLAAVHSLAELSAAASTAASASAAAAGGTRGGLAQRGPSRHCSLTIGGGGGGPSELHARALRYTGSLPHEALLGFIEGVLVSGGSGSSGSDGDGAAGVTNGSGSGVSPDVRHAHIRRAVQLLAAVVHSLATSAAVAGSSSSSSSSGGGFGGTERRVTAQSDAAAGGRCAPCATAAGAAAQEQLLQVCLGVSQAVDRLLTAACCGAANTATGGSTRVPMTAASAASAAVAAHVLAEMLAVPALGQHVLLCATERVRDVGRQLAEGAARRAAPAAGGGGGPGGHCGAQQEPPPSAAEGTALRRMAASAAAFNHSRPLFEMLARCASQLPGWCSLVTAVPKATDVGPDYIASHVQALLDAHRMAFGDTAQWRAEQQPWRPPQECAGPMAFPLYAVAVREQLAATAAALAVVASGTAEFAGCGLVAHCRALCGRIKQEVLLPQ